MKKLVLLGMVSVIMFVNSGCVSYMSYKASEKEVIGERIYKSGDAEAIKAYNLGRNAVGIGIDITAIDVLMENPVRQLLAAVCDAGIIYGISEGIKALEDDDDSVSTPSTATDSNVIQIQNSDSGSVTVTIDSGLEEEEEESEE